MERIKDRRSFTLIELLIVIAIVAILSVVVILTLNPAELLGQARDSNRISDLDTINKALNLYQTDQPSGSLGTASTVYVSIPSNNSDCSGLGLPALPSLWVYKCVTQANLRKIDGNGWIPVNFNQLTYGNPLASLPIDPVNTVASGNYYTYITGGSWELNSIMESSKYASSSSRDGGILPGVYEMGTDFNINYAKGYSCLDIKNRNSSAADGIYWIRPDKYSAIQTYCDMTTAGGGWTLIALDFSYIRYNAGSTYGGNIAETGANTTNLITTGSGSNYLYVQKVLGNAIPFSEFLAGKLNTANINDRSAGTKVQITVPVGQSWPPNARKGASNVQSNSWCTSWYYGDTTNRFELWVSEASNCGNYGTNSGFGPRRLFAGGSQLPWNSNSDTGTETSNNFGYIFGR